MDRADLHMHSGHSDGTRSTADLVRMAAGAGLRAIALTDHDTVSGVAEIVDAAREAGIEVVPGVELSTHHEGTDLHLLGYFVDYRAQGFLAALERFRGERKARAERIVARLDELGVGVPWDEVEAAAAGGAIGRPHIARAMVAMGHVADVEEAFQKWLRPDRPGYVERYAFATSEAIRLVRDAGGLAVLAHPGTVSDAGVVEELAASSLDGLEVDHPRNDAAQRERLRELAARHDLLETGGSDFHGDPDRPGEAGVGEVSISYERVEAMRRRAEGAA